MGVHALIECQAEGVRMVREDLPEIMTIIKGGQEEGLTPIQIAQELLTNTSLANQIRLTRIFRRWDTFQSK